jgi:capsular polysaccharide export protein
LPLVRLEDGFLRSVGLGADEPPLSIVVDDLGIYYDAGQPSRLEQLDPRAACTGRSVRAEALVARMARGDGSKYNHAREAPGGARRRSCWSSTRLSATRRSPIGRRHAGELHRMLEAALDEHPAARIVLKVHPDVVAGRKRGHFPQLAAGAAARVTLLASHAHPCGLLERARAVYTVSSQMGFEACCGAGRCAASACPSTPAGA